MVRRRMVRYRAVPGFVKFLRRGQRKESIVGKPIPKIISPRAHRRFDSFVLPGLIGATVWMSRRNRPTASLVALTTAIEGVAFLTTNFPPGILPWMSFRDHIRAGLTTPALIASLAFVFRDVPPRERRLILALLVLPTTVNALSDAKES